jgi:NADH:ubiquinone oxidoreductase subunit H
MIYHTNLLYVTYFSIEYYFSYFDSIVYALLTLVPLLITVAFFTLAERKVMANIQRRTGPNIVGMSGLLQPFADGLKLIIKEIIIPIKSNNLLFIISPMITLALSFIG